MSKRGAVGQGGAERYGGYSDQGGPDRMEEAPKQATAAQMAKRKYVYPLPKKTLWMLLCGALVAMVGWCGKMRALDNGRGYGSYGARWLWRWARVSVWTLQLSVGKRSGKSENIHGMLAVRGRSKRRHALLELRGLTRFGMLHCSQSH